MFYDSTNGIVYVGSFGKWGGKVHSYETKKYKEVMKFENQVLKHPSGVLVYDGLLFVADQIINSVFTFDVSTGAYIRAIIQLPMISGSKYVVESIALSPC